nr:hypothetical protein B0A51_08280 [Rachicladosporium sp. CCFEE 5018]
MPPINFPNEDLTPGSFDTDPSISLAILNVAVLLAFVLITGYALRVVRDLPDYYRARQLPRHSAPNAHNIPPDADATTPGAQHHAPDDEPIEQWEVVGDDWGIIPDSAEVREERREDERIARSTASLADNTDDVSEGAEAPPPAEPSVIAGPEALSVEQHSAHSIPGVDQHSAMPRPATSSTAARDDVLLPNVDDHHADAFSGAHYGDRHEYTNWDAPPRMYLSSSTPVLSYGSATRLGLSPRMLEPMGMIERVMPQNGGRRPTETSLSTSRLRDEPATATNPPAPSSQLHSIFSRSGATIPAIPSAKSIVPPATQSDFPEDYVPIDLQDADPRTHNETLEAHIRLLQTENASQRQVIETLRQEIESTRRAQKTQLGGPASQAVSTALAPAEAVVAQALPMQTPEPGAASAGGGGGGERSSTSIPPVPTMAFNDESVNLTQHLDSVRVHIQALERHIQLGQDVLLEQIDGVLQRIESLERRLRWREDTGVGKLMARLEKEEEDAGRNRARMFFEGTGLWTRPATHVFPQASTQRADIRTAANATHYRAPSSAASFGRPTPPSSTPSQDADSPRNQFLELTQPRSYPLDPRTAHQTFSPASAGGQQTLIADYFHPWEVGSPESHAAGPILLKQNYEDLYAPASPRSYTADPDPPRDDRNDYTTLYQAVSPRAGDPVPNGRWTFNAMAASFHPDAAEHNLRARVRAQQDQELAEPSPPQLDISPATSPRLSSQGELMAELAQAASNSDVPDLDTSAHDEGRPDTPRTLPITIIEEPSPFSLDATATKYARVSDEPQAVHVPMLDPHRQSIPASVRAASFSHRVPIIPSDTQERRQRRKRRKNAAAIATL